MSQFNSKSQSNKISEILNYIYFKKESVLDFYRNFRKENRSINSNEALINKLYYFLDYNIRTYFLGYIKNRKNKFLNDKRRNKK